MIVGLSYFYPSGILVIPTANALRAELRQFANETASLHCVSGKLQGVRFAQAVGKEVFQEIICHAKADRNDIN